ncbi:gonadotropin-releasing hormone II receptor-like [Ailuropoda melanoleuca]|uniref:gonadotropin-releasing hormone II receptor-like n=1 Tax=Ailuropoda melanoleuca TaxID=9646 RepID=UPI00149422B9|nr:gonadotropin-releasing hormone II receptor-like [Ailuropoda melanoleuca]
MFLKLMAMYAAAFLPVVIGLDRQAAILHPLGPRSAGRKLLGTAWGLSFLLALPQLFLFTPSAELAQFPSLSVSPKAASRLDGKKSPITSSPSAASFCCR